MSDSFPHRHIDAAGRAAPPCFAEDTLILTPAGGRPVQRLAPGDEVVVVGARRRAPVRWVGWRRVVPSLHPSPLDAAPVRVRAGAFGANRPFRDLFLSPDHALFLRQVLVPVRCLIDGLAVAPVPAEQVTYWHVALDRHDVLLAEGLPCESLLADADRAGFSNGGTVVALHPDFSPRPAAAGACAPVVTDGAVVEDLRAAMRARATPTRRPTRAG